MATPIMGLSTFSRIVPLLFFAIHLGTVVQTAPASLLNKSTQSSQRFPRNLHRLYDGTWEDGSHSPFTYIPRSPNTNDSTNDSSNSSQHTYVSHRSNSLQNRFTAHLSDIMFQKESGFALLAADNHPSTLGPNINIVFGNLIFRDGAYRTPRDVSLQFMGVYELDSGTLVVVGDIIYDDSANALKRLYQSFKQARPSGQRNSNFTTTESAFIETLTPRYVKRRKQFRSQRAAAPHGSSVASICFFSASFSITPGKFDDSVPPENEYVNAPPFNDGTDESTDGHMLPGPSLFSGRADGAEDAVNAQDEFVEMKGHFVSEVCRTEMTVVLATLDTETLFGKAINYTLLVTIVSFIQVIVLIRQMEMTSTQAGARRVSLMTVGLQAVVDSYLCLGHLTMGIAVQTLFNAFATAAFFKFICFSIFLMRWMLLIWKARRPSGFSESWEAMRRELSMLYSRFYGSLLIGIFLLYQLQDHIRLFVFALYSFWVPQIILNVVEDHRRPLLPLYIIGTSITRLAIPLYFWACPHNFLHIEPQPTVALALVSWLGGQALILLSQYKFGPRWFIPKEFLPEKYDYFRAVSVDDDEVIDLEASEGGETQPLVSGEHQEARRECCICMESVAIHSRDRMVTPCNHFFHAACLERWLEVRLECALCRSPVPPP